ncbi:MAG TPA: M48 family metalloprotease [Actinomycetota bacterium]
MSPPRHARLRRRVPRPRPGDPLEAFSPDEIAACLAYAKPRQRWAMVAFGVELALLAALALSAPGRALVRGTIGLAGHFTAGQAALGVAVVVLVQALASLPFSLRNWSQDVSAGLATQRLGGFLLDWVKSRAVGLALTVVPTGALILAARWRPPGWPWAAGMVAALLVVALSLLGPVVLEPLFNRFRPLPPGPLRERVVTLAATMGIGVREVLVADASRRTTKVNAYVSGLGRTRRVVVYDTLLARSTAAPGGTSEDEVALVLAHELAHVRHRDMLWGTTAAAAGAAAGVVFANWLLARPWPRHWLHASGLGDPNVAAGLLLLGALGGLLISPLASAVSRFAEARADWTALEVSHDPVTAVAVERRLALENRADLRPNRMMVALFATHPPIMARIAQARLWASSHGVGEATTLS